MKRDFYRLENSGAKMSGKIQRERCVGNMSGNGGLDYPQT
jgi:hypothetical protein